MGGLTPSAGGWYTGTVSEPGRLGDILRKLGFVDDAKLKEGLAKQKEAGVKLGRALQDLGYLNSAQLTRALGEQFGMPVTDVSKLKVSTGVLEIMPRELAEQYTVLPIERSEGMLKVALPDPLDLNMIDDLRFRLGVEVEPVLADPEEIKKAILSNYGLQESDVDRTLSSMTEADIMPTGPGMAEAAGIEAGAGEGEDAPVIKLVHSIISEAVKSRASDIHVEPFENRLRIRFRIDGVCREIEKLRPPKRLQSPVLARIKIMAKMDIAEKRKPQDGQISLHMFGRALDLRVSVVPASWGESIVMRILDKGSTLMGVQDLGFEDEDYQRFKNIIRRPTGIFLVTGPTGSGKTTTLNAALCELNRPDIKIITAENPVEYHISGINQCQVNEQIKFNFSVILRAMLRQAPNIILVGEIRDAETADMAIEAALTGHLVFSTLHTNDAPSAITRLIDMGVKPFLVASSVQAVMAQRLIRILCVKCKEAYEPPDIELKLLDIRREDLKGQTFWRPVGCEACDGNGYRGRKGIYELMELNRNLKEMAFKRAPTHEIRRAAIGGGMSPLRVDAIRKLTKGMTSINEVLEATVGSQAEQAS